MEYLIINKTRGIEVARARVARSFLSRAFGLMFRRSMRKDEGLLIEFPAWMKRPRLHSFFMFFPIEVIFIDENFKVVEVGILKPWRFYTPEHESSYVLEVLEGKDVEVGDVLEFRSISS